MLERAVDEEIEKRRFSAKHYIEEKKFKENPHAYLDTSNREIEDYMRKHGVSAEDAVLRLYSW